MRVARCSPSRRPAITSRPTAPDTASRATPSKADADPASGVAPGSEPPAFAPPAFAPPAFVHHGAAPGGALAALIEEIQACQVCASALPLGPRPVFHAGETARLLIASQAPGTRVHQYGISFWDRSGTRLRDWLGIDERTFYDGSRVAIVPTGFCYPGRLPNGGDAPPRRECAPLWRGRLLALMPRIRLTLLVGSYAQEAALGPGAMTERVRNYRDYLPRYFPLPHPSWRTGIWEVKNPWFSNDVLPALREAVTHALTMEDD